MSAIAIGYNKQELENRINAVQIRNGILPENTLGLAFGKRIEFIPALGIEIDITHVDPQVYLIYNNGVTFEYIKMNGTDIGFEFDITNYSVHLGSTPMEDFSGDYYRSVNDTGYIINGIDRLERSDHESYENFGFTFFQNIHVLNFLNEFRNEDLLLSGAMIYFGKGTRFYYPEESFSLKLEISGTPEIVADLVSNQIFDAGVGTVVDIRNSADVVNADAALPLNLRNTINNLRVAINNAQAPTRDVSIAANNAANRAAAIATVAGAIADAETVRDRIVALLSNDIISNISIDVVNVANIISALPGPKPPEVINAANLSLEVALKIVEVNMESAKVAEIAVSKSLRADNTIARNFNALALTGQLSSLNRNLSMMRTEYIEVARAILSEATKPAIVALALPIAIGEPASVVGPPCPPYWVPD